MKKLIKNLYYLPVVMLLIFSSCQEETFEVTQPEEQETLVPESNLVTLMTQTAMQDGSYDNIIDTANCITVNLPVTVTANGVVITIVSEEGYDLIEELFDVSNNDEDSLVISFPITITLNDYTEVVINNEDELEQFIEDCAGENEDDDDIECIDFQYPISFSIYSTTFQFIDEVLVDNDEELYEFIDNIETDVVVSLNFPITMILADGSTVVVNNNDELSAVIEDAIDDCNEDDDNDWNDDDDLEDCYEDAVYQACDEDDDATDGITAINLEAIYNCSIPDGYTATYHETFENAQSGEDYISTPEAYTNVTPHEQTVFLAMTNVATQDVTIYEIHLYVDDCDNEEPCFEDTYLEICDEDGTLDGSTVVNLTDAYANCNVAAIYTVTYHESLEDAESGTNAIAAPESYTGANDSTIYVLVAEINNPSEQNIYELELYIENCDDTGSSCGEDDLESFLQECIWNVVSYNEDDNLVDYNLSFLDNGILTITDPNGTVTTHENAWGVSTDANNVVLWLDFIQDSIGDISQTWTLTSCSEDHLEFSAQNNLMTMERDCD